MDIKKIIEAVAPLLEQKPILDFLAVTWIGNAAAVPGLPLPEHLSGPAAPDPEDDLMAIPRKRMIRFEMVLGLVEHEMGAIVQTPDGNLIVSESYAALAMILNPA